MNEAFRLLAAGDGETWGIITRSLEFSFFSTIFAFIPGVPLGIFLAVGNYPGKRVALAVVNALTAIPTVVVGLVVYSAISRSGPLGSLNWLFSPYGVVLGQTMLALPIVTTLCCAGLSKMDQRFFETMATLGARRTLRFWSTLREARPVFLAAAVGAFGRITGEVGVSMMLGGNIRNFTRTMTTAIALDTAKGEFDRALSLALALLALALAVNLILHLLAGNGA